MRRLQDYGSFWNFSEGSLSCKMLKLIHMYPATEFGRSESGTFIIDDYFL